MGSSVKALCSGQEVRCGLPLQAVKVNSLGKWKTALQMIAVSALLLLRNSDHVLGDDTHSEWGWPGFITHYTSLGLEGSADK